MNEARVPAEESLAKPGLDAAACRRSAPRGSCTGATRWARGACRQAQGVARGTVDLQPVSVPRGLACRAARSRTGPPRPRVQAVTRVAFFSETKTNKRIERAAARTNGRFLARDEGYYSLELLLARVVLLYSGNAFQAWRFKLSAVSYERSRAASFIASPPRRPPRWRRRRRSATRSRHRS